MYFVVILQMVTSLASAQQTTTHGVMGYASTIRGESYPLTLVDSTFAGQPTYSPASLTPPSLDMVAAYQLARDQFMRLKEPSIQYEVEEITLDRFHTTDWWFYVVEFRASGWGWKMVEPYRTQLQNNAGNVSPPCINIVVLLNGEIIMPQQAGPAYPPQGVGSADP